MIKSRRGEAIPLPMWKVVYKGNLGYMGDKGNKGDRVEIIITDAHLNEESALELAQIKNHREDEKNCQRQEFQRFVLLFAKKYKKTDGNNTVT